MKLRDKEKETVFKYNLDCSPEEKERLKKIAIERFLKDERAQLEYATKMMIQDAVEGNPEIAIPLLVDIIEAEK